VDNYVTVRSPSEDGT